MKPGILVALVFITVTVWFLMRPAPVPVASDRDLPAPLEPVITPPPPLVPVLADTMLVNYASDETSGKEDLNLMATFLDSVFLLIKQRDTADYATNEDLVEFLQGNNSHQSPFLNQSFRAINEDGQLIDRWGSPLIVHPVSRKLLELRSAGPDKTPYTEDDLLWPTPP